jgi:hypothetical protein
MKVCQVHYRSERTLHYLLTENCDESRIAKKWICYPSTLTITNGLRWICWLLWPVSSWCVSSWSDFDCVSSLICGNKMLTRCNRCFFIPDLIACSTCFKHYYAHHQELESIIQIVAACGIWNFGFQVVGMVWSWGLCVRFAIFVGRGPTWDRKRLRYTLFLLDFEETWIFSTDFRKKST